MTERDYFDFQSGQPSWPLVAITDEELARIRTGVDVKEQDPHDTWIGLMKMPVTDEPT